MYHKEIQIRNKGVLAKIDVMAEAMFRLPHTFKKNPIPRADLRGLLNAMNDENHSGVGETNGVDYAGRYMTTEWFNTSNLVLDSFKVEVGKLFEWKSCHILPAEWGNLGWHNSVGEPRLSIRFIWNSGNGSFLWNKGHHIQQIKHKQYPAGQKSWTCIAGLMDESTMVAVKNTGDKPCLVLDMSIQPKYGKEFQEALEIIQSHND